MSISIMLISTTTATGLSYVCKTTNKLSTSRVVVKKKSTGKASLVGVVTIHVFMYTGSVEEEVVAMETEHH